MDYRYENFHRRSTVIINLHRNICNSLNDLSYLSLYEFMKTFYLGSLIYRYPSIINLHFRANTALAWKKLVGCFIDSSTNKRKINPFELVRWHWLEISTVIFCVNFDELVWLLKNNTSRSMSKVEVKIELEICLIILLFKNPSLSKSWTLNNRIKTLTLIDIEVEAVTITNNNNNNSSIKDHDTNLKNRASGTLTTKKPCKFILPIMFI